MITGLGLAFLFRASLHSGVATTDFVHMSEQNKVEYRVNLRHDNGVISAPELGMNKTYAFETIENIEITNTYRSELSLPIAVRYDYMATVSFIGRISRLNQANGTEQVIVDEVIEVLRDSSVKRPQGNFKTTEQFAFNLNEYRERFNTVQSNLDFPISGQIRVDFEMKSHSNGAINNTIKCSVTIPVSEPHFQIRLDGEESQETDHAAPRRSSADTIRMIVTIVLIILFFVLGLYFSKKVRSYKSWYRREVDKLLRDYNDAIIVTTTPITARAYRERVVIRDFKEMLKLATNLNEPIMYYEARRAVVFYILKNQIRYVFLIEKTLMKPETPKKTAVETNEE